MRASPTASLQAPACDGERGCHPAVRGRADIPIHQAIAAAIVADDPFR